MDDNTITQQLRRYVRNRKDFEWFTPFGPTPEQQRVSIALQPALIDKGCPFEFLTEEEARYQRRVDRIWNQFYDESPNHESRPKPSKPADSPDLIVVPGNESHGVLKRENSRLNIALQKHIQNLTGKEVGCVRTRTFNFEKPAGNDLSDLLGTKEEGDESKERSTAVLRREARLANLRQSVGYDPYHDLTEKELEEAQKKLSDDFSDILRAMRKTLTV